MTSEILGSDDPNYELKHDLMRSGLYHKARQGHLEFRDRLSHVLILLAGASSVSSLVMGTPIQQAIAVAITVISAVQLVFDHGRRAAKHGVLARDHFLLLAQIPAGDQPADDGLRASYIRLAADEELQYRAVDAIAYNQALRGLVYQCDDDLLHIPRHHRILAHFLHFPGFDYQTKAERRGSGRSGIS